VKKGRKKGSKKCCSVPHERNQTHNSEQCVRKNHKHRTFLLLGIVPFSTTLTSSHIFTILYYSYLHFQYLIQHFPLSYHNESL